MWGLILSCQAVCQIGSTEFSKADCWNELGLTEKSKQKYYI